MVNMKFIYHAIRKSRWTISGPVRFTLHTPFLWDAFDYIPHAFSYKFKALCLSFRFSEYVFYALPISPCILAYLILLSLKGANCCSDKSLYCSSVNVRWNCWRRHQPSWLRFLWCTAALLTSDSDITSITPRALLSKSFASSHLRFPNTCIVQNDIATGSTAI